MNQKEPIIINKVNREKCEKQYKDSSQYNTRNRRKRDAAQLGNTFVLGTKCHGFKSSHPYHEIHKSYTTI